ncbi:unnamed protein product [Ceratitis capitata]|uniref:(Mediterranean fruit fly) hypothetical protein n=1 Tax=Ceratitis capitata TaxID=7213 RepID=A0A811UCX9_CERCA|nr:unnamed protein product [Ceratitis capitata]
MYNNNKKDSRQILQHKNIRQKSERDKRHAESQTGERITIKVHTYNHIYMYAHAHKVCACSKQSSVQTVQDVWRHVTGELLNRKLEQCECCGGRLARVVQQTYIHTG